MIIGVHQKRQGHFKHTLNFTRVRRNDRIGRDDTDKGRDAKFTDGVEARQPADQLDIFSADTDFLFGLKRGAVRRRPSSVPPVLSHSSHQKF